MPQPKLKRLPRLQRLSGAQRVLDADSPYAGAHADAIAELRIKAAAILQFSTAVADADQPGAGAFLAEVRSGLDQLIGDTRAAAYLSYQADGAPFGDDPDYVGLSRWIAQRTTEKEAQP